MADAVARSEATRLAVRIHALDGDLADNIVRMRQLVEISQAAQLLDKVGIGPVAAATCLTAWSQPGKAPSEAAERQLTRFPTCIYDRKFPLTGSNAPRHSTIIPHRSGEIVDRLRAWE